MEPNTFMTAVVLIPPDQVQPSIQAIRQTHDRHFKRWMPHITLLYPFRPRHEFDQLVGQLAVACQALEPFQVRLAEIRCFRHRRESYTLWLAPEPREAVIHLQAAIARVAPECDDVVKHRDGFTPHLSLGQVRGEPRRRALQHALQDSWQPLAFSAQDISLIWRGEPPDDVFRVAHTIRLAG